MKKDILREKNFGIPIGIRIPGKFKEQKPSEIYRRSSLTEWYEYEIVPDNDKLSTRRGDIIQLSSGRDSKDLQDQYAVILERYRKIKKKGTEIFKDYYAVIMIITGPKKGHVKKAGISTINGNMKYPARRFG